MHFIIATGIVGCVILIDFLLVQVFDKFLSNLETNVEERLPDLPLIENFAVFNTRDEEQVSYGNDEIKVICCHVHFDIFTTNMNATFISSFKYKLFKN